MNVEYRLNSVLTSAVGSHAARLVRLDDMSAHCVLILSAFLKRAGRIGGSELHRWLPRLVGSGVQTEGDLQSWVRQFFPGAGLRLFGACRKRADKVTGAGVKVFGWNEPCGSPVGKGDLFSTPLSGRIPSRSMVRPCPAVLFGKGPIDPDLPLFAVFNSRKPRLVPPDSEWLQALRFVFRSLDLRGIGLAGSAGTLTHDLVGAHASRSGLPQVVVVPFPLLESCSELSKIHGEAVNGMPVLSCMLDSSCTPKNKPQVCRDWIIGMLASFHLVLEIRSGGNLSAALEEIQAKSPRHQIIYEPEDLGPLSAGNIGLLEKFPEFAHRFRLPKLPDLPFKGRRNAEKIHPLGCCDIVWDDYLYHYTRGCAGPWPGEAYRQYLLNLFDARPLSAHSALETLIRIFQEGFIRAGSRMVRGDKAVISWSSHSPKELFVLRKWNRALIRWTVEPYGIAIRRDILRSLGAKPAVYGTDRVYSRLAESERYRFQLSGASGAGSWRHEREWRMPGNLTLSGIKSDCGFVFVRTVEEIETLRDNVDLKLPIVALDA